MYSSTWLLLRSMATRLVSLHPLTEQWGRARGYFIHVRISSPVHDLGELVFVCAQVLELHRYLTAGLHHNPALQFLLEAVDSFQSITHFLLTYLHGMHHGGLYIPLNNFHPLALISAQRLRTTLIASFDRYPFEGVPLPRTDWLKCSCESRARLLFKISAR